MNLLHTVSTCTDSPYHKLRDTGVISVNLLQEVGEDMWVDQSIAFHPISLIHLLLQSNRGAPLPLCLVTSKLQ